MVWPPSYTISTNGCEHIHLLISMTMLFYKTINYVYDHYINVVGEAPPPIRIQLRNLEQQDHYPCSSFIDEYRTAIRSTAFWLPDNKTLGLLYMVATLILCFAWWISLLIIQPLIMAALTSTKAPRFLQHTHTPSSIISKTM